jgi:hypothetical protein
MTNKMTNKYLQNIAQKNWRLGKANINKSRNSTQVLRKSMQFLLYMLKYPSKLFMTGSRFIFRYNFNT